MKTKLPQSTKGNISFIRKAVYSALAFFGTLIVLSVAYAAYQTITAWEYASGQTLSSTLMGKIVGNIDDLNTRINGITTSSGQIRPEVLPFKKGQIVGSGSVIFTGATANSDTGYYQVEELEANRNLISTSVHWGIGKSQVGTMVSMNPTWRSSSGFTKCGDVCWVYGGIFDWWGSLIAHCRNNNITWWWKWFATQDYNPEICIGRNTNNPSIYSDWSANIWSNSNIECLCKN